MDSNEKAFADLEDIFKEYAKKADNALDVLQTGADAFVKDLKALPSPRSRISKPGYTHLIDKFSTKQENDTVLVSIMAAW